MSAAPGYDAASAADPRTHPWGFFSSDPWAGGAGLFLWFASPLNLLAAVREGEAALYLTDPAEIAQFESKVDAATAALEGGAEATTVLAQLDAICEADVHWVGTVDDLMTSEDLWAFELRIAYRSNGDEDSDDGSPIPAAERDDFIDFLGEHFVG